MSFKYDRDYILESEIPVISQKNLLDWGAKGLYSGWERGSIIRLNKLVIFWIRHKTAIVVLR